MRRYSLYLIGGLCLMMLGLAGCQLGVDTEETLPAGMSADDAEGLRSLERVDDYPLYTLTLSGEYSHSGGVPLGNDELEIEAQTAGSGLDWGCSLFASFADPQKMLYGRNFDWEYSPALLLTTRPADGYASVSMVDIAYLDFSEDQLRRLDDLSLSERLPLLEAPNLPFDGMNEQGLVIGWAAVPEGNVPDDPGKPNLGSLGVVREMLDHTRTVEEAVRLMQGYNIDFAGGPPLHYLIADREQHAALVEFYRGEVVVIYNESDWHAATNFLLAEAGEHPSGWCPRYDRITRQLGGGVELSMREALNLLEAVSQEITQWSVVYDYSQGEVRAVMGRDYDQVHTFRLDK